MKYLIIKCDELSDQYECDANRTPICLTDDFEKFNKYGYEIYEITSEISKDTFENTFELIKQYDTSSNEGMAIYKWYNVYEVEEKDNPDEVIKIDKNYTREDYTKSKIKKIKSDYHFKETVNNIYTKIQNLGSYGEEINGEWIVIGEYIEGAHWVKGY